MQKKYSQDENSSRHESVSAWISYREQKRIFQDVERISSWLLFNI
jgi:CRISPR/Cas system-associated endonuclease Cas3-HD